MIMETTVDMAYLLAGGDERFDAYVKDSMVSDRVLWDTINRNVADREGEVLPIEERMRRSLRSKFDLAGLTPEEIGGRSANKWPSIEKRMTSQWGSRTYLGYRAGSHSIHGSWNELVTHHLDGGTQFEPKLDWSEPRPQPLFKTIIMSAPVLADFAESLGEHVHVEFDPRLRAVFDRATQADELHEAYLVERAR